MLGQFILPNFDADPDSTTFLTTGSIYYNTLTDEVRVLKAGGWVTII